MIPPVADHATWGWGSLLPSYKTMRDAPVIDVGCGNGEYLAMLQALGLKVLGVETDPSATEILRRRGIPFAEGTLESAGLQPESAGMVTMRHVIEHLPDPAATLAACWRVLRPGGIFVARTPNYAGFGHQVFGSDWVALDPPRHLFGCTPPGARSLFTRTPFRSCVIRSVATSAGYIYDTSMSIRRAGRFQLGVRAPRTVGREWFIVRERALIAAGIPAGEELEIVAEKTVREG